VESDSSPYHRRRLVRHFLQRLDVQGLSVSMVDGELFDKLAEIGGRIKRRRDEPFGGIQVRIDLSIFVGLLLNLIA